MNLDQELATLPQLKVAALRCRYAEVFGEATQVGNKAWLVKRLAWRLQALAEGDLSERARRRAAELANDANLRLSPPRPRPTSPVSVADTPRTRLPGKRNDRLPPAGTILTRPYKGTTVQVRVLEHGFVYEGTIYSSLSAVAKAITGALQWPSLLSPSAQPHEPARQPRSCSQGGALRDLHAQVHRGRSGSGIQLPGCATRSRGGLSRQPAAPRLARSARALR